MAVIKITVDNFCCTVWNKLSTTNPNNVGYSSWQKDEGSLR